MTDALKRTADRFLTKYNLEGKSENYNSLVKRGEAIFNISENLKEIGEQIKNKEIDDNKLLELEAELNLLKIKIQA